MRLADAKLFAGRLRHFAWRVLRNFSDNKGLLLAGGVAYNALLSLIPLIAVVVTTLSAFFDPDELLRMLTQELKLLVPGYAELVTAEIRDFLEHREVFGGVGLLVLLFFSSLAFRMLEDSMAVIFARSRNKGKRHFLVSALLPYAYILFVGLGITALSVVAVLVESVSEGQLAIAGQTWALSAAPSVLLYLGGLLGEVLLFASVYRVMPVAHVQYRVAIIGGAFATALWEITRHILVWWFGSISLVNTVYGSLATVIVILLTMEVASIILLLGAQVLAELERSAFARVPWYEDPPDATPIRPLPAITSADLAIAVLPQAAGDAPPPESGDRRREH